MAKPLSFNAALMYTVSHAHHGQWRRSESSDADFTDTAKWIALAQKLEAAKFDALFFPDVSGHHGAVDVPFDVIVKEGLQLPNYDPLLLLAALATHTEHIGLALTSNILQNHPFNFARQMSTLDLLSNGRAAWNIVTGWQTNGARNFGFKELVEHDARYEWAQEYVDVTYKLWEGSWDEGAVLKDRENGIYADPSKVHKIFHEGQRYRVEGPHLPAPTAQRTPFLYQAGASRAGRAFAAQHAEGVFLIANSPEAAELQISETRQLVSQYGRRPEDVKFYPGLTFVIGDTEEEAQAKARRVQEFVSMDGLLAHQAVVDKNGQAYPVDTPLTEVRSPAMQGRIEYLLRTVTDRVPTVKDLVNDPYQRIVGTPETIADQLEQWRDAGADGINILADIFEDYAEFADKVIPVLQRRGLAQTDYSGTTLRGNLTGHDRVNARHPAAAYRGMFTEGPRSWDAATVGDRATV